MISAETEQKYTSGFDVTLENNLHWKTYINKRNAAIV